MTEAQETKIEILKQRFLNGEFNTNYELTQEINRVMDGRDVRTVKLIPNNQIRIDDHLVQAA